MNRRLSLATQLFAVFCASIAIVILAIFAIFFFGSPILSDAMQQHALESGVRWLAQGIEFDDSGKPLRLVIPGGFEWIPAAMPAEFRFAVIDGEGRLLLASDGVSAAFVPADRRFDPNAAIFEIVYDGIPMHVGQHAIPASADGPIYAQLAISDRFFDMIVKRRFSLVVPVLASLATLVVIVLAMRFTLHRLLRPLHRASVAAAAIRPENFADRLSLESVPADFVPLIASFNAALDRLEKGYAVQQTLLSSTAHELKTPLMILRGQIEMDVSIRSREVLLRDIDALSRQVHQLLHLAEVSELQNYRKGLVEISGVVFEVIDYLERLAREHGVFVEVIEPVPVLHLMCDRSAVFVLLKNLVENAIKHSPQGESVTIELLVDSLVVGDKGKGIAPDHIPYLFDRFWRAPEQRSAGAGLGLAICKEVAEAHGWRLDVETAAVGARFVVSF